MKKKNTPRNSVLRRGCFATCAITAIFLTSCILYFVVPSFYFSPAVQRFLDNVKQSDRISVTRAKQGELIAFTCRPPARYGTRLYTINADGSDLRLINTAVSKFQHQLEWSPDGDWLVFTMSDDGYWSLERHWSFEDNKSEIYRIRFDGAVLDRLTYDFDYDQDSVWSPDGAFVFFRSGWAASGMLNRLRLGDDDSRQLSHLEMSEHALSPDGRILAFVEESFGPPYSLFTINSDGSGLRLLLQTSESVNEIKWSPDGHHILYFSYNGLPFMFDPSTMDHTPMPIIRVRKAAWSPDGNWIAVIGGLDHYHAGGGEWIAIEGGSEDPTVSINRIFLIDAQTWELQLLVEKTASRVIAWSPDSKWLAFTMDPSGRQLYKIRSDGRDLQQLTFSECRPMDFAWSPK